MKNEGKTTSEISLLRVWWQKLMGAAVRVGGPGWSRPRALRGGRMAARAAEASLLAVHVKVDVKPGDVAAFQVGGRTRPRPLPLRASCGGRGG